MIVRNCSGGLVFHDDKVLLIENDKHEWAFPKGVVKNGAKLTDVCVSRIEIETGVKAKIIAPCGKTNYEFYSVTRRKPVHNNVSWFVMSSDSGEVKANTEENIISCNFFTVEEALELVTYSQDKSLLMMAFQKYKERT